MVPVHVQKTATAACMKSVAAECLNAHWFMSLDDPQEKCEAWRRDYNEVRPHSAIGNKPPIALIGRSAPDAQCKTAQQGPNRIGPWRRAAL